MIEIPFPLRLDRIGRAVLSAIPLLLCGPAPLALASEIDELDNQASWFLVQNGAFAVGIKSDSTLLRWTPRGGISDLGRMIPEGSPLAGFVDPVATSGNGSVVAGTVASGPSLAFLGSNTTSFRWTASEGAVSLGNVASRPNRDSMGSAASGMSATGDVIAGNLRFVVPGSESFDGFPYQTSHAFRWTKDSGLTDLGTLGGSDPGVRIASEAAAVSADGSTIVGSSQGMPGGARHAFRWTPAGGMTDIGTVVGTDSAFSVSSLAQLVSVDGSVVAGSSFGSGTTGQSHAFRWTSASGMVDLGTPDGADSSFSFAVSPNAMTPDGKAIAGEWHGTGDSPVRAFRWTQSGGMENLGTLPPLPDTISSHSRAYAISTDGRVVVGANTDFPRNETPVARAFRWSPTGGLQTIEQWTGKTLSGDVTAISAFATNDDGSVVLGELSNSHTFVARAGGAIDLDSTAAELAASAARQYAVLNLKETRLRNGLAQDCDVFGTGGLCLAAGGSYATANNPGAHEFGANLRLAWRVAPSARIGMVLDQGFADDTPADIRMHRGTPLFGVFGVFGVFGGQGGSLGPTLRVSAAWQAGDLDIARTATDNSEAGRGSAQLASRGAEAEVSHAFAVVPDWTLEPFAGLRYTRVERKAYTEHADAVFPVSFKSISRRATTGLLGGRFSAAVGSRTLLSAGVGLEHDLNRRVDGYAGSVDGAGSFALGSPDVRRTRPFANLAARFEIDSRQQIRAEAVMNRHAIQQGHAATVMLSYSLGL